VNEARPPGFPPTRHSVIERMRDADAGTRREAFGDLVEGYWKPLYKYLRLHWRLADDEAQDVTQAFFSEAFQKEWLARYEPDKARFRTFVRLCADRFIMNARQAASRIKRGGGAELLPLDFPAAEAEMVRHGLVETPDAEEFFRKEFVRTLFERAVGDVRAEYVAAGREVPLALFERYDLDPAEGVSYASLAAEFGLTQAQVTNALAQVRRTFRARALQTLQTLCGTPDEFRREARELFGVEVE
jgi:DNA-directed RNA polymerase specialized sigma24 family protein